MAMVLDLEVRIFLLDAGHELTELGRTADTGHVLEADLVGALLDQLFDDAQVVLHRVDGGVGDGQGRL